MTKTMAAAPQRKVGIVGGGQLGRMLALRGAELGYEVHIFSESADDPAAQVTRHWHSGKISDAGALHEFFRAVDVVTFESEFIAPEPLLAATTATGTPARPSIDLIGQLRDRFTQKDLLLEQGVPTAEFITPAAPQELENFFVRHRGGIVGKKRLFGYDGFGTFILRGRAQLRDFLAANANLNEFIFEPLVRFKKELAISLARDLSGHVICFPLVEWKARDKKCHWVKGPVKHRALADLKKRLVRFIQKIDYHGFITFELFDDGRTLTVNEVAPRVHNSAHYSLNALSRDQFQAHLLAITTGQLKTDPVPLIGGFAMVNLIGAGHQQAVLPPVVNGYLHWYGKRDNRPGRKMGHLNTVAKTADEALKAALREEKRFQL